MTKELATVEPQTMNLALISERILSGELTPEKLNMIKELVAMDAERQFNQAFTALLRVIPQIKATKPVYTKAKDNQPSALKFMVAPFEEIDEQLRPLALDHGFTYSFSEVPATQPGRIAKAMTIFHSAGHKRTNEYAVRIGSGPPGCSESQADGAAHSYAKRGAMCDGFTIIIDRAIEQEDARMEGGPISEDEAKELQRRAKGCGAHEGRFLKFGGVSLREDGEQFEPATLAHYMQIPSGKLQVLLDQLERKERGK